MPAYRTSQQQTKKSRPHPYANNKKEKKQTQEPESEISDDSEKETSESDSERTENKRIDDDGRNAVSTSINYSKYFPSLDKFQKYSSRRKTQFNLKRQKITEKFICFPQGKVVFVVGDSGTGKTTLIQQFIFEEKLPWYDGPEILTIVAQHFTNTHAKIWDLFKTTHPNCIRTFRKDVNRSLLDEHKQKKHLCIIDDMDYSGKSTIANMTYLCNVSASKTNSLCFFIVHNPFQNGMISIRNNCTALILFPNKNKRQTNTLLHQYSDNSEEIKHVKNHLYDPINAECGWKNAIILIFDTAGNGHYYNTCGNKII